MAMTLRLSDEESAALREHAKAQGRSMQQVARAAVREYIEARDRAVRIDEILDQQLPRYADALRRLGE